MLKKLFIFSLISLFFLWLSPQIIFPEEIPVLSWNDLSDKDISPDGKLALSFNKEAWKHAQTEHFVYHFTDLKDAKTIYHSAEIYYKWIKELLAVDQDTWTKKCHIFIFSDEASWVNFRMKAWAKQSGDALTNGWELFMYRKPFYLAPKKTLAHEITHIVVFRFFQGPLPLALNEGLAEFISYRSIARQMGKSEYDLWVLQLIPEQDFIPLPELIQMRSFPKEKNILCYQESELLIRFLIFSSGGGSATGGKYDKKKFYELCKEISGGKSFDSAIEKIYSENYQTFQEKFKNYATKK